MAGQQHGLVCLDAAGGVVRDALLWNDTRSAVAADELVRELPGGAADWADAVGSVPLASFTVAKLRWVAEHEPSHAAHAEAVCLPHDWLTWKLRGSGDPALVTTDRSDASGTGYWSPSGEYRRDLVELAFGRTPLLPRVLGPAETAGHTSSGAVLGAGAGDNAAAALGLGAMAGDVIVSIGTSGVVSAVTAAPTHDPSGIVAGFADAAGGFLPLACTLNAARVLTSAAAMLGVDLAELSRLALTAPPGADGLVLVPYLEGERTPNRPDAMGALHGLDLRTSTPAHLARAAVEGMLCGLADGLDALVARGVPVGRVLLVGGGAQSEAVRRLAPTVLGRPVEVPQPGEYVARGAGRQAALTVSAADWARPATDVFDAPAEPGVRERYAEVRELTARRLDR